MNLPTRISILLASALTCATATATAADPPAMISLWAEGAPGSEARKDEAIKVQGANISNVHDPSSPSIFPRRTSPLGQLS